MCLLNNIIIILIIIVINIIVNLSMSSLGVFSDEIAPYS